MTSARAALRAACPCLPSSAAEGNGGGERSKQPKTVHVFFGFFFVVNFCVGTGFLGVPYAFYYSGFFAAIPTLLTIAFISWTAANWELEVMARAQVSLLIDLRACECLCSRGHTLCVR